MVMRQPQPVSEGNPYAGLETAAPEPPSRVASWILLGSSAALLVASGGFAVRLPARGTLRVGGAEQR